MISAKIIADSKNQFGNRITTFVLTFPRIVLAEFNTHRMLSKNSASSRAIPFKKMVKMVQKNPFIPIKWMKDHSGMQGTEYFTESESEALKEEWLFAAKAASIHANYLNEKGVTKQVCNRLLEPFMWHTVIATGTEWQNFFALRANNQAEIHIQDLAFKMMDVYNASEPKQLQEGEWHVPFGDNIHDPKIFRILFEHYGEFPIPQPIWAAKYWETKVKIATARCARVSYLNFEGQDDYEADIKLYDRLASSGHYSPFEHCAKVMDQEEYISHIQGIMENSGDVPEEGLGWCGNFKGFIQLRKTMQGENKSDNRVINK